MDRILKIFSKSRLGILVALLILILLPLTVFLALNVRPTTPSAAICYDLNGDGIVDQKDVDIVMDHFGLVEGVHPNYDPRHDFDGSGSINVTDIGIIVSHTGETCPPTVSFSASKTRIDRGEAITLRWSSTRASSVSISPIGSVAKSGSKVVRPTSTTTYRVIARGPGGSVSKSITITVIIPSPPPLPPPNSVPILPTEDSITSITIVMSPLPELSGDLVVKVSIDGTKFSKEVTLSRSTKEIRIKVSKGILKQNKTYTLRIAGNKLLTKRVRLKSASLKLKIKVGALYLGDLDGDNKITQADIESFLSDFPQNKSSDLNLDGVVNSLDYSILLKNLGNKGN